jgi:outer membrane lipoprotein-sorting protein
MRRPTVTPATMPPARNLIIAGVLGTLALASAARAAQHAPEALVLAAIDAPHRISFEGQEQVTRWGPTAADSTIVRVEHKAPDRFRRTYLAPEAIYGEYVISRGPQSEKFEPKNARVIVTNNPALENTAALADNTTLVRKNYTPVLGSEETVAGRKAATVTLVNRFTGERLMRLWIDEQTHIILAKETYHSDGSLETRVRFDQIRYTSDIPDSVFALALPAGYHSVQGRNYGDPSGEIGKAISAAGFAPIGPKYLPDGFSIIGADTSNVRSIKSLHLLYSDGLRNLSLFENDRAAAADFGALRPTSTSFEGHAAQYVKQGPTTLLAWHEHDLAFALVGDLDLKEMIEIAKSVVP